MHSADLGAVSMCGWGTGFRAGEVSLGGQLCRKSLGLQVRSTEEGPNLLKEDGGNFRLEEKLWKGKLFAWLT